MSGTTFETPHSLHADPQQKLRPQRSLCYSAAVLVWKTSQSSTRATCGLRGGNSPNCTPVTRSDGHVPIAERPRSADAGWPPTARRVAMACLFATAVAVALSGRGEGSVDISMSGWSRRASRGDAPVKLFLRCLSSSFVGQCDNGPEVGPWSDAQTAFAPLECHFWRRQTAMSGCSRRSGSGTDSTRVLSCKRIGHSSVDQSPKELRELTARRHRGHRSALCFCRIEREARTCHP